MIKGICFFNKPPPFVYFHHKHTGNNCIFVHTFFHTCDIIIDVTPVSYTHLDVYKRQALEEKEREEFTRLKVIKRNKGE